MIEHDVFPVEAWGVRERRLDLGILAETESVFALANGHLGMRGNLDEGEPRGASGTYLGGVYESYPLEYGEIGYGFPEDGQAVDDVTDGKLIRLLVDDEPLDVHRGRLDEHERFLDFRTGILERTMRWTSEAGRSVRVRSRRLVSLDQRSIAVVRYEVEADDGEPVRVAVQSNLLANQAPQERANVDPRSASELRNVLEPRLATASCWPTPPGRAASRSRRAWTTRSRSRTTRSRSPRSTTTSGGSRSPRSSSRASRSS